MKVFVAGATGVIGHRAVRQLVDAGHEVTGLARSEAKATHLESLGARAARVDLFDPAGLRAAVAGHEAVANLATHIPKLTKAALPGAWKENDRIRTDGSRNLVDAALATDTAVYVQESVTFVYDDSGSEWITEESPITLVPYVESVMESLRQTRRVTDSGRSGVFLRFGMFYAPDAHHTQDFFRFARRGIALDPTPPDAYKSMVHADDAAAAVVAALAVPAGTYNVCEDDPMTAGEQSRILGALVGRQKLRQVTKAFSWMAGSKIEMLERSQRVSNRRFREASGWAPRYPSLREGYPAVHADLEAEGSRR